MDAERLTHARADAVVLVERLEVVERQIKAGWTFAAEGEIARTWGVSRRTVSRYRKQVERLWARGVDTSTVARERAAQVGRLVETINEARDARDYNAVAALEGVLARVLHAEAPARVAVRMDDDRLVAGIAGILGIGGDRG